MLDFYTIEDDLADPEYPEEYGEKLILIGQISLAEHRDISILFGRANLVLAFSFYEDVRINSPQVNDLLKEAKGLATKYSGNGAGASFTKYLKILEIASRAEVGLISFCD
ncbi:MAG: hypothetical protein AB8G05_24225 [Oligoflexales bacterium]